MIADAKNETDANPFDNAPMVSQQAPAGGPYNPQPIVFVNHPAGPRNAAKAVTTRIKPRPTSVADGLSWMGRILKGPK